MKGIPFNFEFSVYKIREFFNENKIKIPKHIKDDDLALTEYYYYLIYKETKKIINSTRV